MKREKGFTLAELLIVVAIIGILVAIAIPVFGDAMESAQAAACKANKRSLYGEYMYTAMLEPDKDPEVLFYTIRNSSSGTCPAGGEYTLQGLVKDASLRVDEADYGTVHCSVHDGALPPAQVIWRTVYIEPVSGVAFEPVQVKNGNCISEEYLNSRYGDRKTGYHLIGWSTTFTSLVRYDFSTPVTSNFKLHGFWAKNVYTITFDAAGGSFEGGAATTSKTAEYQGRVSPAATPTREGYTFENWYLGDEVYNFNSLITGDLTLTAHWVEAP